MRSPSDSIETADGVFARAFADIAQVLALADEPEARVQRALELLRDVVAYEHCAILIDAVPQRLFATVPASHTDADRLRVRLHRLLQTVRERPLERGVIASNRLPASLSVGSWSLAVPLVTVDAILGILHAGRNNEEYTVHELRLLSLAASQFAAYVRGLQFLDHVDRARIEAEQASRGKDRFLATMSHEMRTPLNVIQGWLHILGGGQANEAVTLKAIAIMERNVAVQVQLVEQLMDAARIATGKFHIEVQRLEILPIITATVDGVRPSATLKSIELECVVPSSSTWMIDGDAARLQRAFANVLVNAIKFTPTGGFVRVSVEQHGSRLETAIRDTGIGIAADQLPNIFEPLWQSDGAFTSAESGLGLGLSIVRQIVQLHGGEVLIESDGLGRGTTVTICLPLIT